MVKPPYVISGELELVGSDLVNPDRIAAFRESLLSDLDGMGKEVAWVGSSRLRTGLGQLALTTKLPIVSLDRRYVEGADDYLDVSRAVRPDFSDAGYDARTGALPLAGQLNSLGRKYAGSELVLADDVLFTGEMIASLQAGLAERGIRVPALLCGIAIGEGAEKLTALGIETGSVVTFPEVEDELCERDFTALPGSGRKIAGTPRSALYFDDRYGRPEQWASIAPEAATGFCVASLVRNRQLLRADAPFPDFAGYPAGPTGDVLSAAINQRKQDES